MNINARMIAAAVVLAATASAQAADWYVGGSVGQSRFKDSVGEAPAGTTITDIDRTGTGFKLLLGASLSPNLAVEGGYADLGKASITLRQNGEGGATVTGDVKGQGYFADVVGKLPVAQNWALFGKLGVFRGKVKVAAGNNSDSDTGTSYKVGFGAEYALAKNIAVRAEWERYRFKAFNDAGNADLLSVGVTFGF